MKNLFPLLLFVSIVACPAGEEPQGTEEEPTENNGGSTPCTSDSDCGVWRACVQGVCAEGSAEGTGAGNVDGSTTGTPDGSGDGNTTGSAEGQNEEVDAGATDGAGTGNGDGQPEVADAGSADGNGNSGAENLALTATAVASEEWSDTWSADKAIDGSMITYWSTADGLVSATFTVTLSEAKSINKIVINSGDYPMKSFELLVSNDGSQYFSIGQYETAANEDKAIEFAAQNASHVRLDNITADPGPAWTVAAIYELEIYESQ